MRIVFISDTHSFQPKLPEGDLLVHSGDFTGGSSVTQVLDFLDWMAEVRKNYPMGVVLSPGNHDGLFEKDPSWCKDECAKRGLTLKIHEAFTIDGLDFFASPYTPRFGRWSFMRDRGGHIAAKWKDIPKETTVLITHGPAHGILDKAYDWPYTGKIIHVGCEELKKAIKEIKPYVHACGHIHGGYGKYRVGKTLFLNNAICDDNYQPINPPQVIDI